LDRLLVKGDDDVNELIETFIMPRFGEAVATLRENCDMNQSELASKAEISRSTLENIEQGKSLPQMVNFFKLCLALDITPEEFMKYALSNWKMYKNTLQSSSPKTALLRVSDSQTPQDSQELKISKTMGLAGGVKSAKIKLRLIIIQIRLYYTKVVMKVWKVTLKFSVAG